MSKAVQRRRGTTAEHTTFTGALGELTVDTTKDTVVVHDGAAAGGYPLLREDGSNSALAIASAGAPSLKFTGDPNTGLYSPGADQVAISTGGTERARIDSSGRLLVGTSSARSNVYYTTVATTPSVQFETVGNSYSNGLSLINYSASGYSPVLTLGSSSSNTQGVNAALGNGFEMASINFAGSDGTNFRTGASITATNDQASAWAVGDCPTRLVFSTTADGTSSPTERMRISQDGHVSIGTTSIYQTAHTMSVACATGTGGITIRAVSTATNYPLDFQNSSGASVGSVSITTTSTTYSTSSDYRLKENVIPVTDGITRLQQLKPSRFNFIADPDTTVDGFIAHEAQAVVPECVTGEKDAVDDDGKPIYQGIDQSKLVPLLTAALQEAIGRIETLEAEVTALKA